VAEVVAAADDGDDVMTELTNEEGDILTLNYPDEDDEGKGFE
jgi:hypothetical protein